MTLDESKKHCEGFARACNEIVADLPNLCKKDFRYHLETFRLIKGYEKYMGLKFDGINFARVREDDNGQRYLCVDCLERSDGVCDLHQSIPFRAPSIKHASSPLHFVKFSEAVTEPVDPCE